MTYSCRQMKKTMKKSFGLIAIFLLMVTVQSCVKKNDISLNVNITHDDYNSVEATYVSTSISVDGEQVPLDFNVYSNIGVGDTRSIAFTVESSNEEVDVAISINPVGSGSPYTVSANGVSSGAVINHTVGESTVTIN